MKNEEYRRTVEIFFRKFWPYIVIFLTWFLFSSPYFLQNKVPYSATFQVNHFAPWSAYEKFWGPVKNGAMPDVTSQIFPWKHFTIQTFKQGQIPFWNPYSFSGTPHLANYQSAVFSPFNLLFFILPFVDAWSVLILLQPLLAGLFTYLYSQSLKVSKPGSIISSLAFMFCGFITVWMGYGTLGYAILFLPLALFSIEKFYQENNKLYLLLLVMSFPLSFFSGHFQISLYFLLFTILYFAYNSIFISPKKSSLVIGIFILFGLMMSAVQLAPSMESYSQSLRSSIYQKNEAIPWVYLPTLLAPDFFGNPVTRNDWLGHYAEWNGYIGILPLFLAILTIFRVRKRLVIFFFIAGIVALLLAFDSPLLTLIVLLKIPVLSTSAASRAIVLFSFSVAVLSGFGLDILISDIREREKHVIFLFAVFVLFFIFLWLAAFLKLFLPADKAVIARSNLFLPTALFLGYSILVLIGFLSRKKQIIIIILVCIIALTAFDVLRFVTKWQAFDPKNLAYPNIAVTEAFKKISGYDRVIGNFGAETSVYYNLPSTEGYDAVYIRRYGEFIASVSDGKVKDSYRSVVVFPKNSQYTPRVVDILGVKYAVHKRSDDFVSWTFPFWKYPNGQFKLIWEDDKYQIYENTRALPRVFLASSYSVFSEKQEIIDRLLAKDFNPSLEVVLEQDPKISISKNRKGTAKIVRYSPNIIYITTSSKSDNILFLSDSYYPGWRAFVDKKQTPIYRADFAFRALFVPKGDHTVVFEYKPLSFRIGLSIFSLGLFCVFATLLLPWKSNRD